MGLPIVNAGKNIRGKLKLNAIKGSQAVKIA